MDVFGGFEFVDEGDGVVFGGDGAVSLFVGDEGGGAETEFAGALAGLDESWRREIGPQKIGLAEEFEGVAMGDGDGLVFLGQMAGVDEVDSGSDLEAAGSADEDEAAGVGFVQAGDEGAGGFDEVVLRLRRRARRR